MKIRFTARQWRDYLFMRRVFKWKRNIELTPQQFVISCSVIYEQGMA